MQEYSRIYGPAQQQHRERLYPQLLKAVQLAYRKHHLQDPSIGWDELDDVLATVLQEAMGDRGFQAWLATAAAD